MRVAYLGNFGPQYSTENIVARALEANGHEVDRIQEGTPVASVVGQACVDLGHDLFLWTQTYGLACTGGDFQERHDMLAAIKVHMPTVGYHLDKWWQLEREDQVRSGEAFFAVDRLCTADGGDYDWAGAGVEHRWFPPAVDEAECVPGEVRSELEVGVTFVGGWTRAYHRESRHRHELIAHLQRKWRRQLRLVPRDGRTRVNGQALRDVYASAKVVVGDSCLVPNAPRYWSDRIPETVGRGGFLIHPYVEGIEDHFTDGKHLRLWQAGDWAELDRLIGYYLAHDDERRAIAEEGRRHVLEHHTYTVRMRQLVAMLREEGLLPKLTGGLVPPGHYMVGERPEPSQWPIVGERGPEVWAPPTSGRIVHPNNMAAWDEIACKRGHGDHVARLVHVDLARPHGYADLTPVPARLARSFDVMVWDPGTYPVDGGPYCPAHDAVSETIANQGIWEPAETALTLAACGAAPPNATVVDFGAQVGWFSLLAASCGLGVLAIEADPENVRLLTLSATANGWADWVQKLCTRIGPDTPPLPERRVALAKVDVEGAERDAIRMLWPSIEAGMVDHLLVEVTPVFDDYYPDLVADLVAAGFRAYVLPPKSVPPTVLDRLPDDLEPFRIDGLAEADLRDLVGSWTQEMVWFAGPDAAWA